jgi:hypothetical protein
MWMLEVPDSTFYCPVTSFVDMDICNVSRKAPCQVLCTGTIEKMAKVISGINQTPFTAG